MIYLLLGLFIINECYSQDFLSDSTGNRTFKKGVSLYRDGKYHEAVVAFELATKELENQGSIEAYIQALNWLGLSLTDIAAYDRSDEVLEKAQRQGEKFLGKSSPIYATSIYNQSKNIANDFDRLADAQQLSEIALSIRQKVLGHEHPAVAISYNLLGYIHRHQALYQDAMQDYLQAKEVWDRNPETTHIETSKTYFGLGWVQLALGKPQKAVEYNLKALELRLQLLGDQHPIVAGSYWLLATCYNRLGRYQTSIVYAKKSLDIWKLTLGPSHINVGTAHNTIGDGFMKTGEYQQAIYHYQQCLDIWTFHHGENYKQLIRFHNKLSDAQMAIGNKIGANESLKSAMKLLQKYEEHHPESIKTYQLLAEESAAKQDLNNRWRFLQKMGAAIQENFEPDHHLFASVLSEEGDFYRDALQPHMALKSYQEALRIYKNSYGPFHPSSGSMFLKTGDIFLAKEQLDTALACYQQALVSLSDGFFEGNNLDSNPKFEHTLAPIVAVEAMKGKARCYASLPNIDALLKSLQSYQDALDFLDKIRIHFQTSASVIRMNEVATRVYDEAINVARRLYHATGNQRYLLAALRIADRSKAFLLHNNAAHQNAGKFSGVPDSLVAQEMALKGQLTYSKARLLASKEGDKPATVAENRANYLEIYEDYETFLNRLESEYVSYFQLRHNIPELDIEKIRSQLAERQEAIVEFQMGEKEIYAFLLSEKDIRMKAIPKTPQTLVLIEDHYRSISDYAFISESKTQSDSLFVNSSHTLYTLLIKDLLDSSTDKISRLTIIPDGELWRINWPTLLTNRVTAGTPNLFKSLPYLIRRYHIAVGYSAALLTATSKGISRPIKVAGFAPNYEDT
ncbi:MAG: tetratricopeptide repeat protein, partial [Cyclobacteriaceae bacterium]|nr:tetratricopeptide repeat protein [Cyclobacteriaceae bacterium HetDA_MAG_MS6]